MKLRKTIKKIVALGTGATMLGATLFGATAADLSNYPEPFLKDGVFDGAIVVGDSAKASDVVGAIDIATSLQSEAVTETVVQTDGSTATVSVEGDAYKIQKSGNDLNLGEDMTSVLDSLTDAELDSLASGTLQNQKGSSNYNQFIRLADGAASVIYSAEDADDDDPRLALKFADEMMVYEYEVTFNPAIESDVDDADDPTYEVEDIENKKITLLGNEYTILDTEAKPDAGDGDSLKLGLMSGAIQDTLQEYTSKTYTLNDVDYEIEVVAISSEPDCILKVNGEVTDKLTEDETYTLNDGTEIGIKTLLENEGSETGGGDIVEFYLGASKVTLEEDTDWDTTEDWSDIEYGNDEVDAVVNFDGTWNDGGASDSTLEIDGFTIRFNATEDYYIGTGDKLSEQLDSDEKGNLFMENLDFQFAGLERGDSEETMITGNDDQVEMSVELANGYSGTFYAFYNNAGNIALGEDSDDVLVIDPATDIGEGDYFVLTTDKESRILQLDSIDDDEVVLLDALTGDTAANPSITDADPETINLDGNDYVFTPDVGDSEINFDNFGDDVHNENVSLAAFYTDEEAKIVLQIDSNEGYVHFIEEEKDDNDADEKGEFEIKITDDSGDVNVNSPEDAGAGDGDLDAYDAAAGEDGVFELIGWDSDDDLSTGYSAYGTWFEYDTSNDENELTIDYPEGEASVAVYVTSGVTSTSESAAGEEGAVVTQTVNPIAVGTAKLASEINLNNLGAQNLIVVGGPCVNAVAAKLMDNPQPCYEGFEEGEAIVKLYETSADRVAMLVAGATQLDTRRATRVLANYDEFDAQLTGMEVAVLGTSTTFSDTVVSAVAEDVVEVTEEEEEAEDTNTTTEE